MTRRNFMATAVGAGAAVTVPDLTPFVVPAPARPTMATYTFLRVTHELVTATKNGEYCIKFVEDEMTAVAYARRNVHVPQVPLGFKWTSTIVELVDSKRDVK